MAVRGGRDVGFSCRCGAVAGQLTAISPRAGTHLRCHCGDCRSAARHFETELTEGAVALFQMSPDRVRFTQGQANLAILRLSPSGLFRWYAACCNTALCNTLARPRLAFVGMMVDRLYDPAPLGKIRTIASLPGPPGSAPRHKGMPKLVWGLMTRMIAANLSDRWRDTPFFDPDTGAPIVTAQIMPKATRDALRA
ncbi:DUF6151 family protein [Poseidonocella sedimentorum]|uniref:CENP-V/GFA domain-containing protein n=1 Tax=Poseidonocella sedimentorum TaxID=871652 RepID=A0A1I6CWZ6_9RHOB|nr:DUF6151 family protein [Poseidonocella sedimentorum]SFQ97795.1 hypothetical protein SAMN04515673_101528 [Poseidonocella sedimentorum]